MFIITVHHVIKRHQDINSTNILHESQEFIDMMRHIITKCQFALILNLINERRNNDLSRKMEVTEKDKYSTIIDSELQGCDEKLIVMICYRYKFQLHCIVIFFGMIIQTCSNLNSIAF